MTLEAILITLLIGAIAGWLAGLIVTGAGFGLLGNIVIGILGAFVSAWLLPRLGVHIATGNILVDEIVFAMIGGIVILVVLSLIRRA